MSDLLFRTDVLIKADPSEDGDWIVSGPVCSLGEDYDGETLEKAGILNGLKTFFKLGAHIDWEHLYPKTKKPQHLIGKALEVVEKGGVPHLVAKLFKKNEIAQGLWELLNNGGEAGFSIYGLAKARDPKNSKRVTDTEIHMVTISPSPKGFDARITVGPPSDIRTNSLLALAKAIMEHPYDEEAPADTPADAGAPEDAAAGAPPPEAAPPGAEGETPEAEGAEGESGEQPEQLGKSEVEYRPAEGPDEACGSCGFFSGGSCAIVKGLISPKYVCDAFQTPEALEQQAGQGEAPAPDAAQAPPPAGAPPMTGSAPPPFQKAVVASAQQKCGSCGGNVYCIHCHRAAGKQTTEKAMTTGAGVVGDGPGTAATGTAAPLRKQDLMGARKRKQKAKSALEARVASLGVKNSDKVSKAILAAIKKH